MPGDTRVFVSHTSEDTAICVPLVSALDAWEISYYFDASPTGTAPMLAPSTQQALTESSVFIRVCTRNTNTSIPMSLESNAFRGLQAQRRGKQRTLINLILDNGYQREPFDNATLFIDGTAKSRFDWLGDIARALGITTMGRRVSRRSALALGVTGAVALASATSAGVVLKRNAPSAAPRETADQRIATLSGQPKWTQVAGQNGGTPSVAAASGTLYVFSDAGLAALAPSDGHALWSQPKASAGFTLSVPPTPAIAGSVIYAVDSQAMLYAVKAKDGSVLWSVQAGKSAAVALPVATGDAVYLLLDSGPLAAFKPADGSQLWTADIGEGATSSISSLLRPSAAVSGGTVYVGSDDHHLYALNAGDGTVKWKFLTRGRVRSTPVVANGRVVFGSEDSHVYALNSGDGSLAWSYQTDFDIVSSPAVVNGVVYIGSRDKYLYALDAQKGFAYWRAYAGDLDPTGFNSTGDQVNCLPAVGEDAVYITAGAFMYAFSILDGKRLWRYKTGATLTVSSPVIAGNLVYAGAEDKKVYAVNI